MPNILLLCFDQLPTWLLGFMGNPHVETPALDFIASKSIVFDRAYTTNPIIPLSKIIKQDSSNLNIEFTGQSKEESYDHFVEKILNTINASNSKPNCLIFANAIGISESVFVQETPASDLEEASNEIEEENQIEEEPPEFVFIESLDESIERLFDGISEIKEDWSIIITASKGLSKTFETTDENQNETLSQANVHIPLLVFEPAKRFCERDSRLLDLEMISEIVIKSLEEQKPISKTANLLLKNHSRDSIIFEDADAGVSWRSPTHCLKLSSRYYEKLKEKDIHFMETASELEVEEFTCEAKLYLKPEDYWEHNNVSKQFPETTKEILSKILEHSHQQ